jgi:hypothetical protein
VTILIQKSKNADTRTCDYSKVTKDELFHQSLKHIGDVSQALNYFKTRLETAASEHDRTKLTQIDQFHSDFKTGFDQHSWWDNHTKEERHHLSMPDGVRDDVDLIDVLEFIADGVMAGLARSGEYRKELVPDGLLGKAFDNTVQKLLSQVVIFPSETKEDE